MKKKSRIIKTALKDWSLILLFLFLVLFIWSPLHELLHMLALELVGKKSVYTGTFFRPIVHCINCEGNVTRLQVLYYAGLPYLIDLLFSGVYLIKKKSLILQWISGLAYGDILANYAALVVYFFNRSIIHDFIIMAKVGFWYVPILIFIVGTLIWAPFHIDVIKKLFRYMFWFLYLKKLNEKTL